MQGWQYNDSAAGLGASRTLLCAVVVCKTDQHEIILLWVVAYDSIFVLNAHPWAPLPKKVPGFLASTARVVTTVSPSYWWFYPAGQSFLGVVRRVNRCVSDSLLEVPSLDHPLQTRCEHEKFPPPHEKCIAKGFASPSAPNRHIAFYGAFHRTKLCHVILCRCRPEQNTEDPQGYDIPPAE